ncbi:hypothetical protein [Cupriavidus necator]|nr:hypothetical protein [Cupriavidus necator]
MRGRSLGFMRVGVVILLMRMAGAMRPAVPGCVIVWKSVFR